MEEVIFLGNYLLRYLMPEDFDFTFSRPDKSFLVIRI